MYGRWWLGNVEFDDVVVGYERPLRVLVRNTSDHHTGYVSSAMSDSSRSLPRSDAVAVAMEHLQSVQSELTPGRKRLIERIVDDVWEEMSRCASVGRFPRSYVKRFPDVGWDITEGAKHYRNLLEGGIDRGFIVRLMQHNVEHEGRSGWAAPLVLMRGRDVVQCVRFAVWYEVKLRFGHEVTESHRKHMAGYFNEIFDKYARVANPDALLRGLGIPDAQVEHIECWLVPEPLAVLAEWYHPE